MNKRTTLIVDNDSASAKKLRADLAAFPEIEVQEVIPTAERAKIAILEAQSFFCTDKSGLHRESASRPGDRKPESEVLLPGTV